MLDILLYCNLTLDKFYAATIAEYLYWSIDLNTFKRSYKRLLKITPINHCVSKLLSSMSLGKLLIFSS